MSDCKDIVKRLRANCVCHRGQLAPSCFNCQLCAVIASLVTERDEARESLHYANGCCDLAMKHRDMAEAEEKHLREALERIATVEPGAECGVGCDQIARAALRGGSEGKP